jgi:hypothetical protein
MTTAILIPVPLLPLDSPPIYRNPGGRGFLVDFGGILPEQFASFDAAVAEIAARRDVPPTGSRRSTRTSVVATAGGAGSAPAARLPQGRGGIAPGSESSPQDQDPGASSYSRPAVAVGTGGRADHIENGAAA